MRIPPFRCRVPLLALGLIGLSLDAQADFTVSSPEPNNVALIQPSSALTSPAANNRAGFASPTMGGSLAGPRGAVSGLMGGLGLLLLQLRHRRAPR